jgi:hypothetical protein
VEKSQAQHGKTSSQTNRIKTETFTETFASSSRGNQRHDLRNRHDVKRGKELVIESSTNILSSFLYIFQHSPASLFCWTMCQQAFNACMILLLDAAATGSWPYEWLIRETHNIFVELHRNGVHRLAAVASTRIGQGLAQLAAMRSQADNQSLQGQHISVNMAYSIPGPAITEPVMDHNAAMYLLEDLEPQSYAPAAFQPFHWGTSPIPQNAPDATFVGQISSVPAAPMNTIDVSAQQWGTALPSMEFIRSNSNSRFPNVMPPSCEPDRRYDMLPTTAPSMQRSESRLGWDYAGVRD